MRFSVHRMAFENAFDEPSRIAVIAFDRQLTWRELNQESRLLSDEFARIGLRDGQPVSAIVACMQSGLPYVPIDSSTPPHRQELIMSQIGSTFLVDCTSSSSGALPGIKRLRNDGATQMTAPSDDHDDAVVYVLFTSGSTGIPKGVQISRKAVVDLAEWLASDFGLNQREEVFFNHAPFSFDLSHFELIGFLHFGATILLCDHSWVKDGLRWHEELQRHGCTTWVSTPSLASVALLNPEFKSVQLPRLKTFLFCGEVLQPGIAQQLMQRFPACHVLNTYGPTEATVATTQLEIDQRILDAYPVLPVGYTRRNARIILDPPDAAVGEIIIIGDHVSVGYINDPELNRLKFFVQDGKRAYRTGDLGYWQDGMLFFAGRNDSQIKLHGHRIELGEIDACLSRRPEVLEVLTLPLERDGRVVRLLSVVKLAEAGLNPSEALASLRKSLFNDLPAYMVPSEIRHLVVWPYDANHKIDRKKLLSTVLDEAFR